MTFINTQIMAEIECEKIIAKLARKGFGFHQHGRHLRVAPLSVSNVGYEELLKLRLAGKFYAGMELEMMDRFYEIKRWYEEVVGEHMTGNGGKIGHKTILNDCRLYGWLEPTADDKRYYKYAIINAKKWHKTITTGRELDRQHRFAWRSEFWETLKNDCTLRELDVIENDIFETLEYLKGMWSALKFTPKNERKSARYDALKAQFGQCYNALQMIEEERFDRDKKRMQDENDDLRHWHPLDNDPIFHERDAYRMRLHFDASLAEKMAQ